MRNPAFASLLASMAELHDVKNHDYAQDGNPYSNFCQAADVAQGFSGIDAVFATMIGVKLARLRELTSAGKTPNNESIADTRKDLAMYAALWASYYDHVRGSRTPNAHPFITSEHAPVVNARPTYDEARITAGPCPHCHRRMVVNPCRSADTPCPLDRNFPSSRER